MKEDFLNKLKEAVDKFRGLEKKPIRIICHHDSDGVCSASILTKALIRENLDFSLSIVKGLTKDVIRSLSLEDYNYYIFADLGSGQIEDIKEMLKDKLIFILDHHELQGDASGNIFHLNPCLYGIDGGKEVCGAGVSYLFCKTLNEENKDLAYLAVIGDIGEMQEKKGFIGLNDEILNDALSSGKLGVKNGLRMFGFQTRPIYKVLQYSTDPYIPGVTGYDVGAIDFLQSLGIVLKDEYGEWRKLVNLNEEEMKKLVTGIILRRMGSEKSPDDVLGNIYFLVDEEDESPMKDAREFATLLNACGRLGKVSLGIGACLGDKTLKKKAISLLDDYKKEIINSLNWFYDNRKSSKIIEENGFVVINAESNVRDTMVGTLISMLSRSNLYADGTVILSMAYTLDGEIKISLRLAGYKEQDLDLRELIMEILGKLGSGSFGGHKQAAGAVISQDNEERFLEYAKEVLQKMVAKLIV